MDHVTQVSLLTDHIRWCVQCAVTAGTWVLDWLGHVTWKLAKRRANFINRSVDIKRTLEQNHAGRWNFITGLGQNTREGPLNAAEVTKRLVFSRTSRQHDVAESWPCLLISRSYFRSQLANSHLGRPANGSTTTKPQSSGVTTRWRDFFFFFQD